MNIRKGKTVAKVEKYEPGYEELAGMVLTTSVKEFDSLNQAKKANGLNAKTLKRGEHFPPTVEEALAVRRKAA